MHEFKNKCEYCIHNEVCSKKDDYLSDLIKIGELHIDSDITKINVYCDKFISRNAPMLRN